jgi:hypothetical protein
MSDETVQVFMRTTSASPALQRALEQALKFKSQVADTRHQVELEEEALKVIEADQARMRANMQRVPPTSEAYKRYLKKFDDQETEIEKRREQMKRLQATADSQAKAYDDYLKNLDVQ